MRTTVTLPDPLLRTVKRAAAARGVTLSVFLEDAARAQLTRSDTKATSPFRLHTVRGRLLQPDLDLDRTSDLVTFDDEAAFRSR